MQASGSTGRSAALPNEYPSSLWRNRSYLLLLGGQGVSLIGTQVSLLAYPLLALALTGSPAQAGFLGAARSIPYLVLGLPAGALVDRWDRKRLMIVCDAGRALALGSVPLALALGHLTLVQVYVVALVEGTLNVFFNLAETAAMIRVVSHEQIPTATAQHELMLSTSAAVGPAISGLVFGLGRALPFALDAISYAVSVVSVRFITTELNERRDQAPAGLVAEIREGLEWIWHQPLIRFIALLSGGAILVESGYLLAVIVLAQRMGASSAEVGFIFATAGVGSIIGASLASRLMRWLRFGQIALVVFWLWALLLPLYAVAPTPLALGAIAFAVNAVLPIFFVAQFSYRLRLIPDALSGRVNSLFRLTLFAGQPAGLALAGPLIERIGPAPATLVYAALLVLLALAATLYPTLRHAPRVGASEATLLADPVEG